MMEMINVLEAGPSILTQSSVNLPSQMLPVCSTQVELQEQSYEVRQISLLWDQYPSIIMVPTIYILDNHEILWFL